MMKRFYAVVALVAALSVCVGQVKAGTVTFDDAAGNAVLYQQFGSGGSFSDNGLTFTNEGSNYMYVWDGSSPNSNGTNNNIFTGFSPGDYERITLTGGGTFNLNSIDLAISWYDSNPTEQITVNGNPLTITQALTTYNLNLTGVTEVDISGVASGGGYWTADNIVYNAAATPEPASLTLLGLGALSLAGYGYRRRKAGAV